MPFDLKILTVDQTWSDMVLVQIFGLVEKMLCMYELAGQTFKFWTIRLVIKVQIFWEGHKDLCNLPHGFDIYWVSKPWGWCLRPFQKSWTLIDKGSMLCLITYMLWFMFMLNIPNLQRVKLDYFMFHFMLCLW